MKLCKYGCGRPGIIPMRSFYGRKRGEFCCSESWTQCPTNRAKASIRIKNVCDSRSEETKSIIKQKRLKTLANIDESGISGFTKNALAVAKSRRLPDGTYKGIEKTKNTKRSIKDNNGNDIYIQTAVKTAITRFGYYSGLEGKTDFERYRYQVYKITNKQPLKSLANYSKRGGYDSHEDPYHLDHKYSIVFGFKNNIPAYIIGHISNLEFIPARKNNSKGSGCSITKEALFESFFSSPSTKCLD